MTFGLFLLNSVPPWKTDAEEIHDGLEQIRVADELGFHSAWIAEHNARLYGVITSAPVYLAAAAAMTKRIRLGSAVVRLPLHHPIRLAEELSFVDVVSRGRLDIGVGKGYDDHEFAAYNVDYNLRDELYLETLDILKTAMTYEKVSYSGNYYHVQDIQTFPRPIQKPMPPLYVMVSRNDASIVNAAKQGHSFILGGRDYEDATRKIRIYRETALAAGYSEDYINEVIERSGKLVNVHVAETTEQAVKEYEQGLMWYMNARQNRGKFGFSYEEQSYDYYVMHGNVIIGSPEKVREDIRLFREKTGLNHMLCWFNCGGQPQAQVLKSLRLFAEEVMPYFSSGNPVHESVLPNGP